MKITKIKASDLVKESMTTYAKEAIENRALPDFRDGLKPSQRRLLYYMWANNIGSNNNYKVSADVVGGVIGKLHPHGDASMYGTAVTLNDNVLSPLDGHGGWGDIISGASAMRYTKTRLSKFGDTFLQDLKIADYIPNYTGEWEEPLIIPAPLPYALLAGTTGIAVGVATNIPGHNLKELVSFFKHVLKGEEDLEALIGTVLLGPESKYGGVLVSDLEEVRSLYETGKGRLEWRCDYTLEFDKEEEQWRLIVVGIPEAFSLGSWIDKMEGFQSENLLQITNECSKQDPIRFVIRFDNADTFYEVIEPTLYCSGNYNFNVIRKEGETPEELSLSHFSLLEWAQNWLSWREEVEIRLVEAEIKRLEAELFREETKLWALKNIDEVVALLKKSMAPVEDLMKAFDLKEQQAQIIAQMQLQAISRLSKEKQLETLKRLKGDLSAEQDKLKRPKVLVENTLTSLLKYESPRRAKVVYGEEEGDRSLKKLKADEGKPIYWGIEKTKPNALIRFGSELPLRKRTPYIGLVNATKGFLAVSASGEIVRWRLSEMSEGDAGYGPLVGMVPTTKMHLVIALNNGLAGNYAVESCSSDFTTKLIHDVGDKVTSAVGVDEGDLLWVYDETTLEAYDVDDWQPMTRANKSGWRGFTGSKARKNLKLLAIPKDFNLVLLEGRGGREVNEIPFKLLLDPEQKLIKRFLKAQGFWLYNPRDDQQKLLVVAKDGTRFERTGAKMSEDLEVEETYLV